MSDRIRVGVREIALRDAGPGRPGEPAVLLLHGGGFDRRSWGLCASALAERHRTVCLDLPGHGESRGPACRDAADAVGLVEAVREQLLVERWIFAGHSMGGAVAQACARAHRDRVAALALVSTAPHFGLAPELVERWRADGLAYPRERLDALVSPGASDSLRRRVLALRDRLTLEGAHGDLDLCLSWDGRQHASGFRVPVLVMTAPHDIPVIRDGAAAWADSLPDAELCTIPDSGHVMMIEQPERTAAALVDWVDRTTRRLAGERRAS